MAVRVEGAAHLGPGRAREHQWTAPGRALDKVRAQFRLTLARNLRGRPLFIKFLYREENCTRKDHTTFPVTRSLLTRGADPDTLGWIDPCGEGSVNRCLYLPCKRIKPQRLKRPRTFLYSNWTLISLTAAGKRSAFISSTSECSLVLAILSTPRGGNYVSGDSSFCSPCCVGNLARIPRLPGRAPPGLWSKQPVRFPSTPSSPTARVSHFRPAQNVLGSPAHPTLCTNSPFS